MGSFGNVPLYFLLISYPHQIVTLFFTLPPGSFSTLLIILIIYIVDWRIRDCNTYLRGRDTRDAALARVLDCATLFLKRYASANLVQSFPSAASIAKRVRPPGVSILSDLHRPRVVKKQVFLLRHGSAAIVWMHAGSGGSSSIRYARCDGAASPHAMQLAMLLFLLRTTLLPLTWSCCCATAVA